MVYLQDGRSCLLWDDLQGNRVTLQQYPKLYSFAKAKNITVKATREASVPQALFNLPLSDLAFHQLEDLAYSLSSQVPKIWIVGRTSGVLPSSLNQEHINISQDTGSCNQSILGYGSHPVKTNTRSSFGYCLKTD